MVTFRYYDENERIDYVWYDSSNILFSKCEDIENDFKILTVVFKNGGTYKYKDVNVNDYVMFVHGGTDGSNGRALNTYIKPKCEFEKLENTNLTDLNTKKEQLIEAYNAKNNPKNKWNILYSFMDNVKAYMDKISAEKNNVITQLEIDDIIDYIKHGFEYIGIGLQETEKEEEN